MQSNHGDNGDHGVLQSMPQNHHPVSLALGLGRADVVLPHNLQHRAAGSTHNRGRRIHAQRYHWHDHLCPAISVARGRKPAQSDGENQDQHQALPEHRHGNSKQSASRAQRVQNGVLLQRRHDPEKYSKYDTENNAPGGNVERHGETDQQLIQNRCSGSERGAEVSLDQSQQHPSQLLPVTSVDSHFNAVGLYGLWRGIVAQG